MSAPSVFQKLRKLQGEGASACIIFEYDKRFAIYGDEFVFYDYNKPLDLPDRIAAHSFDIVVADPPYLSEECLQKTSETIRFLTRAKVLLCTGRRRLCANARGPGRSPPGVSGARGRLPWPPELPEPHFPYL